MSGRWLSVVITNPLSARRGAAAGNRLRQLCGPQYSRTAAPALSRPPPAAPDTPGRHTAAQLFQILSRMVGDAGRSVTRIIQDSDWELVLISDLSGQSIKAELLRMHN